MALGLDVVDAIIREHVYRPATQAINLSCEEVSELVRARDVVAACGRPAIELVKQWRGEKCSHSITYSIMDKQSAFALRMNLAWGLARGCNPAIFSLWRGFRARRVRHNS